MCTRCRFRFNRQRGSDRDREGDFYGGNMAFDWGLENGRWPAEAWAESPLETLALKYDTVEQHGWYANLDLTVDQIVEDLAPGERLIDYSGGTGILAQRLIERAGTRAFGLLIADSSPKFLRLALEKFRDEPRLAFRLIRFLRPERRLQSLEEVLISDGVVGAVDGLVSTNAIHLYYGLADTLASWHSVLRPGGRVYVQSGNINNPGAAPGSWIIDETVEHIHRAAVEIVQRDDRFVMFRPHLEDADYMERHGQLRQKYFLPVRPLSTYVDALTEQGFVVQDVSCASIPALVSEWNDFLTVYHEGVLGWIGGAEKITGQAALDDHVQIRKALIREAMDVIFDGEPDFLANWTYIRAQKPD